MFLRVTEEFQKTGWHDFLWITHDAFVTWSVTPFLRAHGVDSVPLESRAGKRSFVDLPLHKMWWTLFRELAPQAESLLSRHRPDVLFVGNDRGLIEKQIIRAAKRVQAKTILVQDGLLWRHEVRSYAARHARTKEAGTILRNWGKRSLGQAMRAIGRPDAAPSYMGQGGCDRICVMGESTKRVLEARGVDSARIVVTGQPRYDDTRLSAHDVVALKTQLGVPSEHVVFTFFGATADADVRGYNLMNPPDLASELVSFVQRVAPNRVFVILKPHPREDAAPYERVAMSADNTIAARDLNSLDLIQISDVAISFVCTTIAETVLFEVTPVVLRMGFAGSVSESLGLPEGALLEFSNPDAMFGDLTRMLDGTFELPLPDRAAARWLVHQPEAGAAAEVVSLARDLVDADGSSTAMPSSPS